ncbi:hypothetical protein DFP72DRAFT_1114642 [Ephemerocybe angulata]|uniref:Uncharacterized protein n=1 Tax=Ephemerocybe angulata TaxID=980116 RepID=A0A8H6M5Z9_9AGAR|nr:hypothetical protein DFP72DRAFT_1114642 [Tulosesus angulatus]
MRPASILALIPLALSLGLLANAYDHKFDSREYVDELSVREDHFGNALAAREILSEISTRELVNVLSERLERRDDRICKKCGMKEGSEGSDLCNTKRPQHSLTQTDGKWSCSKCRGKWNTRALGAAETRVYEDADIVPAF